MWLQAYAFDIVSLQHTHNHVKTHAKIHVALRVVYESACFFVTGRNVQNLYPKFSFTIVIVFTVVQVSIILDS